MFDYKSRIKALQSIAVREGIDYFFIAPGANLLYFTGLDMHMSERPTMIVVPKKGEAFAYCPKFESGKVKKVTGIEKFVNYSDEEGPYETLKRWVKEDSVKEEAVISMEFLAARLKEYDVVKSALPNMKLVDARDLMAELRMAKDEKELELIQKAADISDEMIKEMLNVLEPGVKESDLRKAGMKVIEKHGVNLSFMSVASGPKASDPHSTSEDRVIEEGEFVIIDTGALYEGYTSDITRTLPAGKVSEKLEEIYNVVKAANKAGKEAVRPGVTCEYIDQVTRKVIEDAGYGEYFTHRTGHGMGLEVHEEPYIVEGNKVELKVGHVFTVEPGIYIPGLGGVRIEDNVVVTKDGSKTITNYPREMQYK
jgi:Xaa-Pro dipeptidase